jgi:tetratricopeptide (TPR) repeat protein
MKQTRIFLFIILIITAGCASIPPKQPSPVQKPTEKEGTTLNIDVSHVEVRIQVLENLLRTDALSDSDRETVLALLDAYGLLKKSSPDPVTGKECDILTQSLFQSMSLMENTYFENLGKVSDDENSFADFMERQNEILDLYLDKNYAGVIQRTLALQTSFPNGLTPEIGMMFAISLANDGMLEEAIEIGSEVAKRIEKTSDAVQFRGDIAQWQLALGQRMEAVNTLEKISRTQDDRSAMINDLRDRIERMPKEPDQPFHSMFQPPEGVPPQEVQPRMVLLQEKVDALTRQYEFNEARQLLLNEKAEREEGPETELIDRALNNIDEAETAYEESVKIKETYLKQTYESAKKSYEKEDYKEAIATLEALGKTQKLNAEAADLKSRAIESLINRERNRAAELFLEAKKTQDLEKKRALLGTSYKILKTLVEDYPQSPLKHKLMSHMNIVLKEMGKL